MRGGTRSSRRGNDAQPTLFKKLQQHNLQKQALAGPLLCDYFIPCQILVYSWLLKYKHILCL